MPNISSQEPATTGTKVPHTALVFLCPVCECELEYVESRPGPGGDAPTELNDYFRCPAGCGTYEHERHAHRMRLYEPGPGSKRK